MRLTRWIAAAAASAALSFGTVALGAPALARAFTDLNGVADANGSAPAPAQPSASSASSLPGSCGGPSYTRDASRLIELDAGYASYRIYNPSTNAYDQVKLRAYGGCPTGPTINVDPGQTLNVTLVNTLPPESADTCPPNAAHDTPHCFNTINLHLHGVHVSPSGNSDNVFLSVPPGGSLGYRYQVPSNHPAGTFWYHSHRHGSAAIDVASGMEGVLVVRGHRTAARRAQNGGIADIDTILHDRSKTAFPEHVFLFQQIEYGCFADAKSAAPLADPTTHEWICPPGGVGELRNYTNQLNFVPDPRPAHAGQHNSTWAISGR